MKFLNKSRTLGPQSTSTYRIENYLHQSKIELDQHLPEVFCQKIANLSQKQRRAINSLRKSRDTITIKPADKNLGIAIMNTDDYVQQCLIHLASSTYNVVSEYPNQLQKTLENIIISFKTELINNIFLSNSLYCQILPKKNDYRIPLFYGIPKIHKPHTGIPPVRPIVSQTNSLFSLTAKFLDHVLQPLARSYSDYLHNSTSLINVLTETTISDDSTLVTMDIVSLFPSIPQMECLSIINEEIRTHRELVIFDPNFIIQLLHLQMTNNYFEFSNFTFHQKTGIAMGAAFSPTVANIFMSVFFRRFFQSGQDQPLLIYRYIDDIFLLWPKKHDLSIFVNSLNHFHPNINFTVETSDTSIDFLDITIYKHKNSNSKLFLETKTFQKSNNLYQYLHYDSEHPQSTFKGIVIGECIRYIRTNSLESNYLTQLELFKIRLKKRGYPIKFINKNINKVKYSNRLTYIKNEIKEKNCILYHPIFKCLLPPQLHFLRKIILHNFKNIQHLVNKPIIITTKHNTINNLLVRARHIPTPTNVVDIYATCHNNYSQPIQHPIINKLPPSLHDANNSPISKKCLHRNCATCQHLNEQNFFNSTVTKMKYHIRHPFSCSSFNIIYLITCAKCRKQYVGKTTKTLRERVNHHRASIRRRQKHYIYVHFNFPDHKISDLSVQIIDTASPDKLDELEHYWISKLQTLIPKGLNFVT